MTAKLITTSLLIGGLALGAASANADDDLAAALVLGGTGAVIGHAIGGGEGAVVGGFLGAVLGAAAADDNDRHVHYRYRDDYRRYRPPVYVIAPPPPPQPHWRHHWRDTHWPGRDWRDDHRRAWPDRDHDGRRDW